MLEMIRRCLFLFTAGLFTAFVSAFFDSSVKRFEPDLETQPGLWTSLPADTLFSDDTGFSPEVEDNSDLFDSLPADDNVNGPLASSDLEEGSNLASGDSSCGSQDSSSALPADDAEIALDLPSLNGLEARGFLDDVDKLNEIIDSPDSRSCGDPNMLNARPQGRRPRVYMPKTFIPDVYDKIEHRYPVDEFGKCPVIRPEYKEAVCCTGGPSGIYILRCAPGAWNTTTLSSTLCFQLSSGANLFVLALVSFFCNYQGNQYCCKQYHPRVKTSPLFFVEKILASSPFLASPRNISSSKRIYTTSTPIPNKPYFHPLPFSFFFYFLISTSPSLQNSPLSSSINPRQDSKFHCTNPPPPPKKRTKRTKKPSDLHKSPTDPNRRRMYPNLLARRIRPPVPSRSPLRRVSTLSRRTRYVSEGSALS